MTDVTAPLWTLLDAMHPDLWRAGKAFPPNEPALGQLLADAEIDISFAFNPGRASAEIAAGNLPDTVRTFVLNGGTIGNASFVAIPFNSSVTAGAEVIANLILDPAVQARAQDPAVLGFLTVLDVAALPAEDAARFAALDLGVATLSPADLGPALLEPHASWATALVRRLGQTLRRGAMIHARGGLLRFAPHVTLTLMAGPVLAGLVGTLIPALGLMGGAPFATLMAWPGIFGAAMLSLTTGLASTALSLAMVLLILPPCRAPPHCASCCACCRPCCRSLMQQRPWGWRS